MKCPTCGNEMRIVGSATEVTGDKSASETTRVFHVATVKCVNPQCTNKAEETVRSPLYEG